MMIQTPTLKLICSFSTKRPFSALNNLPDIKRRKKMPKKG